MKIECGHLFTKKIEGMHSDIATCGDLMAAFRKTRAAEGGIDVSVSVLTQTVWPPLPAAGLNVVFPEALLQLCDKFQVFYNSRYNGRKLEFLNGVGSADLVATFDTCKVYWMIDMIGKN